MKNTEIVNHKRVGGNYTMAQLRPVIEKYFTVNKSYDSTKNFILSFASDYADYSVNHPPVVYYFQVIKNDNPQATKPNCISSLSIPIIPVGWDKNSKQDMDDFVKNASSMDSIKNKCLALNDEQYSERINENIVEAYNYILFSLAERYAEAAKSGDNATASMIKNLAIMQDSKFDFESLQKLQKNKSNFSLAPNPQFGMAYASYKKIQEKYRELMNVLNEYRVYDTKRELDEQKTAHTKSMFSKSKFSQEIPSQFGE